MNYYLLQQDPKAKEVPRIVNWFGLIDVEALERGQYDKIQKVTVLEAETAENSRYKELIVQPFFLVPKECQKYLKAFEPWMEWKDVILWDRKRKKNHKYLLPLLKRYDCLSNQSSLNMDCSVILKGILKKSSIPDQVLFLPEKVKSMPVIAREDFLEAMLQNEIFGFTFTRLQVVEE